MTFWQVVREESYARTADSVLARTHRRVYTLEHEATHAQRRLEIRSASSDGLTAPHFRHALRDALELPVPPASIVLGDT
jgi:hypothetical protein